jgi:hypothetical protein
MAKSADVESPDEVQLEQDFGRLAYTFLKDRAAGLMPYLLGFEVVEREEDGSRAVGIFGFKIGKSYFYVPSFFVNNQIKGMDLLYSKDSDMFIPLREPWIDYLVNRQTITLGGDPNETDNELNQQFESPRMDFLAEPPSSPRGGSKTASAMDVIHDGFGTWNALQQTMVECLEKDAEFQQAWAGAIAKLSGEPLPFEKSADGSQLIDWIQKKGGVRAVNSLLRTITENAEFAKAAMTFYPNVDSLFVTKFAAELAPEKQAAKITVITEKTDYLNGKEKKRLVRDGFTIHDTRDDSEKSEVYEVDYEKRFSSPDRSGLFNVLMRTGGTTQAWVFMPSNAAGCDHCVVVDTDAKNYFLAEPSAVYVRGDEFVEGKNAFAEAKASSKMEPGKKYILINDKGDCTKPFEVRSVIAEDGKRVKMRVYWKDYPKYDRPTYGHDFDTLGGRNRGDVCCSPCSDADYIQLADYDGKNLSNSGKDTLVIPANWKALELGTPKKSMDNYEAEKVMEDMFQPGSMNDVFDALSKHAFHKLAVGCDDGLEYYVRFDGDFVDGKPMNYKSAMLHLVGKYGLDTDDAEVMLKDARAHYKSRRMVKLSQMVGASMPAPPPQSYGVDQFTGAQVAPPQVDNVYGQTVGQTPPQNSVVPGFNLGGEAEMDMGAAGLAQEAANAGQKQVFDHAAIGGLSNLYDSAAVIDSYVPELLKSLDRLGRIIFLFYWKNEEFAERYGEEDLAEMEDMLRGVFKSYGDLVLKLRQKSIDSEDADSAVM